MSTRSVKAIRTELGVSQAQLAALMGTHKMSVSKWERGIQSQTGAATTLLNLLRWMHRNYPETFETWRRIQWRG